MSLASSGLSHPSQRNNPRVQVVPQYRFPTPPPSGPLPSARYSPPGPTGDVTTISTVTYVQQHPSTPVTEGLSKAYEECKNVVMRIGSHCRAKNRKFRDIDFDIENDPNQCLYSLMDSSIFAATLEARRVTEIFENPVFYSGTIDSAQAVQGAVENCYLVSALSTLTSTDRLIQNLCVARDEEVGVYGFIFYRDCYWVSVIIDDLLFTRVPKYEQLSKSEKELYHFEKEKYNDNARKGAETLYFSRPLSGSQETWIPLVEKAFAKLHGDYASLMYGRTCDAIEDLTGGVSNLILSRDILDKDKFWEEQLVHANKDRLFGCWFKTLPGMRSGIRNAFVNGLVGNLSYSVVRAVEIKDKRFVVIRDPWGNAGWDGPWSDGSKEWTKDWLQILPQLGYAFGDKGQFVMEYKDFLNTWQEIQRTRIFDDKWIMSSQWLHVSKRFPCMDALSYGDVIFKFSLPSASPTVISFSKYNLRYFRDIQGPSIWNLDFILAKDGESEPLAESSYSFFYTRSVSLEIHLEAGDYIVLGRLDPIPCRARDYFAKGLDGGWDRRKLARVMTERAKGQSVAANYTANPQLLPSSVSTILSGESTKPQKSAIETVGNINAGESLTVTTTTTTVMQKKDVGNARTSNNVRISNYSPSPQRYYNVPHAGFAPGTLPVFPMAESPINPTIPPHSGGSGPVPVPLPPSPSPPPVPISPIPLPQRLSPIPLQPLAPPLMTDILEDDHSIVVGLKVYTMKNAPTSIVGRLKSSDQAKDAGNLWRKRMNHLLKTLTESQVRPATDLRLLLTTVKEARKQFPEAKLTDPFYDALEGLLLDLKTVTVDNRDAEAFLKPVSKAEVPDYYDVISNPMDFQTMLRKVKQKSYRSKREFQDDLDLIWSNCYTYNASENHPLRRCVDRLKTKAERLLRYITDKKDRYDPPIPSDLPTSTFSRPRINGTNGYLNGRLSRTLSPSVIDSPVHISASTTRTRANVAFPDSPAVIRTAEGMAMFVTLDKEVGSSQAKDRLVHKLKQMAPTIEVEVDTDSTAMAVDMASPLTGEKRKMNGVVDHRPSKRARIVTQYPTPLLDEKDDLSQLWWGAVQSDDLLANGLPGIPFGSSSSISPETKVKLRHKRLKRPRPQLLPPRNPKSLLSMMNNNIKTMRRIRHTHAKFVALNALTAAPEDEDGETNLYGNLGNALPGSRTSGMSMLPGAQGPLNVDDDMIDDKIDERPWMLGRGKEKRTPSGVDIGEERATDCLDWATEKILEHIGFQGTSKVARDVLSGVMSEFLSNVGRTIRFLTDKFGKTMTPEEIILHTMFESGTSKIQELERYVSDDIERHGTRLGDLEKKLVSAYHETTSGEALEDEGLFEEESDGETGALAMGDFADVLGEDYLGLRELGIADEFGLSALSVPKKLLRGKKGQSKPAAAKPTEPPPPFPPPSHFVPFTASMVEDQIGLLKSFYQNRFVALSASTEPSSGPLPPPRQDTSSSSYPTASPLSTLGPTTATPNLPSMLPTIRPDLVLPDDNPNPAQLKISPIGQILKSGAAAAASKKKSAAAKTVIVERSGVGNVSTPPNTGTDSPTTKKKAATGVANGRKKKPDGPGSAPPPVFGGQGGPILPAVVIASA